MADQATDYATQIQRELEESIAVKRQLIAQELPTINAMANILSSALTQGKKILLFGNGGSAADSQHIAAEFVGRFRRERSAMPAVALTTDTSILTSIANDYDFAQVFSRQIEAIGRPGDVALGISTSGNSANVLGGLATARRLQMATLGFTGGSGGKMIGLPDVCFCVPSTDTAHIQEAHITVAHAMCEVIEREMALQVA